MESRHQVWTLSCNPGNLILARKWRQTLDTPPPMLYNGVAIGKRSRCSMDYRKTPPSSSRYPEAFFINALGRKPLSRDLQQQSDRRIIQRSSYYHLPPFVSSGSASGPLPSTIYTILTDIRQIKKLPVMKSRSPALQLSVNDIRECVPGEATGNREQEQ